jgi:hypothetical protein
VYEIGEWGRGFEKGVVYRDGSYWYKIIVECQKKMISW